MSLRRLRILLLAMIGLLLFGPWIAIKAAEGGTRDWSTCTGIDRDDIVAERTAVAGAYANAVTARFAYYRTGREWLLNGRYWDPARSWVIQRVAGKPLDVPLLRHRWCVQSIRIRGNAATLRTREWWRTDWTRRSFRETNAPHTITMRNVQGVTQKKWVVVRID
jgi:hypothetical protein